MFTRLCCLSNTPTRLTRRCFLRTRNLSCCALGYMVTADLLRCLHACPFRSYTLLVCLLSPFNPWLNASCCVMPSGGTKPFPCAVAARVLMLLRPTAFAAHISRELTTLARSDRPRQRAAGAYAFVRCCRSQHYCVVFGGHRTGALHIEHMRRNEPKKKKVRQDPSQFARSTTNK